MSGDDDEGSIDDSTAEEPQQLTSDDSVDGSDNNEFISTGQTSRPPKIIDDDDDDDDDDDKDENKGEEANKDEDEDEGEDEDKDDDEDKDEDEAEAEAEDKVDKDGDNGREDDEEDDDDDEDDEDDEDNDKVAPVKDDGNQNEDDDDESDDDRGREPANSTLYDFDIMMAKKKEENSRKRKRRNYDIINDNDDIIAEIIHQMKDAVEVDSEANKNKIAATRKLKLLPFVISQLRKVDLRDAFLDSDVLSVITEWLAPLPDRSLPHLNIRESLLKILIDFNLYDVDRIKSSGIGKAVMYLYKHPKETKENKQRAKQLISCWSRPIFQLDSSFSAISREEREQRDLELMSKQRRVSKHDGLDERGQGTSGGSRKKDEVAQKPGDKGWIPRARVPAPSMRDYVIRPRSKVDGDVGKSSKRPTNMLEKYMKNQQDRRRAGRQQRAVNMKIDRG